MQKPQVERKLAAIVAADVAGYSRLMGADEEGTLAQLKGHRRALVDPKIREHRGTIVKTTGDGMLLEFASAVDAVRCSVEIQRGMAERNASVPPEKRIEFRVGINIGDIMHDDRDIFGDGVNVAARLEALAEPGGICVSQSVQDAVREKLGFTFEDIGDQSLKNIAVPVHTYRVRFGGDLPAHDGGFSRAPRRRNLVATVAAGFAAVCIAVAIGFTLWPRRAPAPMAAQPMAAVASAPLPLPDKPSIAVLPFASIGGDERQDRLADGLTEDLITDLSRYREFFVIARNSVMVYKGKPVNVREVGRDLGVRYVLEGSLQTSGDRARVTAQLIEAATEVHVWSERYDRPLDDIFEVQNEVTHRLAAALGPPGGAVAVAETASARRKPPASLQAYDYYLLGMQAHLHLTEQEESKAIDLFQKALDLDPQYAAGHMGLGFVYVDFAWWGWGGNASEWYDKSKAELLKAIDLDPTNSRAYTVLGMVYMSMNDFDRGLAAFEQSYNLNPNDPTMLALYGSYLPYVGRAKEGAEMVNHALRFNPHPPKYYWLEVDPFYATGMYDQVVAMLHRYEGDLPWWSLFVLAISYAQMGQPKEAAAAVSDLTRHFPDPSFERLVSENGGFKDVETETLYREGARKAGIPECATEEQLRKYPKMKHIAFCDVRRATN